MHTVLPVRMHTTAVEKPKGTRADVGEMPFGNSLERSRVHKWTSQLTLRRLPFVSRVNSERLCSIEDRSSAGFTIQSVRDLEFQNSRIHVMLQLGIGQLHRGCCEFVGLGCKLYNVLNCFYSNNLPGTFPLFSCVRDWFLRVHFSVVY